MSLHFIPLAETILSTIRSWFIPSNLSFIYDQLVLPENYVGVCSRTQPGEGLVFPHEHIVAHLDASPITLSGMLGLIFA